MYKNRANKLAILVSNPAKAHITGVKIMANEIGIFMFIIFTFSISELGFDCRFYCFLQSALAAGLTP